MITGQNRQSDLFAQQQQGMRNPDRRENSWGKIWHGGFQLNLNAAVHIELGHLFVPFQLWKVML
jgi:hypothetical protein